MLQKIWSTGFARMYRYSRSYLPIREFNNADFPASFGPKTKHWKTFLSVCFFLRSMRLLLVIRMAEEGSPE